MLRFASPRPGESPAFGDGRGDDEIRTRVEATLHRAISDALGLPCQAAGAACSAVHNALRTVTQPIAVTRSVFGLVRAGVTGRLSRPSRPDQATSSAARPHTADAAPRPRADASTDGVGAVIAATLLLEDYESLPASHVVARLDRLDRSELEAIHDFEDTHRGRRTVLGRIEQLLAER